MKHRKTFVYFWQQHEGGYWLKLCGEEKRNLLNRCFNKAIEIFKLPKDWKLHSALDSKDRFLNEQKQIEQAKKLGLSVPKLVIGGRRVFATECAGQPITDEHSITPKTRLAKATSALIDFHKNNVIHGRPAMRDILINGKGKITYIDFEESRMSGSATLRARDILLLLLDSYRLRQVSQATRLELLTQWHLEVGKEADTIINRVSRFLTVNRWIPKLILRFKPNRLSKQLLLLDRLLFRFGHTIKPSSL